MKISREWLEDYIDLAGISDEDLAAKLTSIGHAVEGTETEDGDTVLEIEFTANRLDAMSHKGLARELSAALDRPMKEHDGGDAVPEKQDLDVAIDVPEMCTRYVATLIRGVTIGPSPQKIRTRLEALGHRSINNIVDITNYVMLALGHPLHAFDYERLEGRRIVVRAAREGETHVTLDEVERKLAPSDCVIADENRTVALGGIMGGANSEIGDETNTVLLECAHFDPVTIRLTARRLGMSTDASYRFERAVDPRDAVEASRMAAALVVEHAGGTIEGMREVVAREHEPVVVRLREERLALFSASTIGLDAAERILTRLGMESVREDGELRVDVPSWRSDVTAETDLIEEILRIHGYDRIPSSLPRLSTGDVHREETRDAGEEVRDLMQGMGLTEVITYSFLHPDENRSASTEEPAPLTNALTENISVMRTSVIPGLLQILERNASYGTRDGAIFEVGRTYHSRAGRIEERDVVSFLLFGTASDGSRRQVDYLDAKGIVEEIGRRFRAGLKFRRAEAPWARKGHCAAVELGGEQVGLIGVVTPELTRRRGYKGPVVAGELGLRPLLHAAAGWKMHSVSRYPGVPMALALVHEPELEFENILEKIDSLNVEDLREVGLWDRFEPKDSERVKTTLAMWYQSDERSLTQDEVSARHERLKREITGLLPVEIV